MADADVFKAGDVVTLRSGGPKMTVEHADAAQAWCVWIDKGKQQRGEFSHTTLMKPPAPGIPKVIGPR